MGLKIGKWLALVLVVTLTTVGVLLPAGTTSAQASGTNLLQNASFEQELEGWGVWEENPETADVEITQQEAEVHDGAKALKAGGHSGVSVTQYVTSGFAPGDTATLSYWGKLNQGTNSWSQAQVSIRALKGAAYDAEELFQYKLEMDKSNVYKSYTTSFTVPEGTVSLEVSFYNFADATRENIAYVDQIELTATPAGPQPGGTGAWNALAHKADASGIDYNPLKGMVPFSWQGDSPFPHSMEWFYIPLKDLMTGYETFDWSAMEASIDEITARGNQAIPRVYLDFPMREVGTPQFLIEDGVAMRDYTVLGNQLGQSQAPDWNDEKLITALTNFITAFGAEYDGDPRIAFVQTGIYGFWGEWHTYPQEPGGNPDNLDWRMAQPNKDKILTAFKNAFDQSIVITRDPSGTTEESLKHEFGYFDDSFAHYTIGDSWYFWPRMVDNGLANNWKSFPMGGEINPAIMDDIFKAWSQPGLSKSKEDWAQTADLEESIRTTHASWIANYVFFNKAKEMTLTPAEQENALKAHRMIGYELQVSQARLFDARPDGLLQANVKIQNKGIAPFAAEWPVTFAALDGSGTVLPLGDANLQLKQIMPGDEDGRVYVNNAHGLAEGSYKLLMQVKNPMPGGHPLTFANEAMHADQEGWLTLGSFAVSATASEDETAPSAPGKPQASDVTPTGLRLTWEPSSDDMGVAGYDVFQDGVQLGSEQVMDASFTVSNLTPETEYSFTVLARDAAGRASEISEPLVVKTPAETGSEPIPGEEPDPSGSLRLEAENFTSAEGNVRSFKNQAESGAGGNGHAGWTKNGDVIQFEEIDFGAGYNQLAVRYATAFEGGSLEVRTDAADGPVIGTVQLPATAGWGAPGNWEQATIDLQTPLKGIHTLYVIFKNGTADGVCDLDWIRFQNKAVEPGTGSGAGGWIPPLPEQPVVDGASVLLKGERQGTNVKASLSESTIEEALASAVKEKAKQLTITVEYKEGDNSVILTIPADAAAQAKSAGLKELRVRTGIAEAAFSLDSLESAVPADSEMLTVSMTIDNKNKLTKEQAEGIGNHPIIEFFASIDGKALTAFDSRKAVRITIPYVLQLGELAHTLVLYQLIEGELAPIRHARYDASTHSISTRTGSLTSYVLGHEEISVPDAERTPWAEEALEAMAARGLFTETEQSQITVPMTRGELVAKLVTLLGLESTAGNAPEFNDVDAKSKWAREIATAVKLGIAKGKGEGEFGADDAVTREELAVFVYRALQAAEYSLDSHTDPASPFRDHGDIHAFASEAVHVLASLGVIQGTGQSAFAPHREAALAEVYVLLYRLTALS